LGGRRDHGTGVCRRGKLDACVAFGASFTGGDAGFGRREYLGKNTQPAGR